MVTLSRNRDESVFEGTAIFSLRVRCLFLLDHETKQAASSRSFMGTSDALYSIRAEAF
jgi:hypothetical protein